jgi:hypothetical protein
MFNLSRRALCAAAKSTLLFNPLAHLFIYWLSLESPLTTYFSFKEIARGFSTSLHLSHDSRHRRSSCLLALTFSFKKFILIFKELALYFS